MKKRVLSLFMALIMCLSLVPTAVWAETADGADTPGAGKGIIAYGYLPLMLLVNCPLKNGRKCSQCDQKGYIVDRMNIKFPIRCHRRQYSELLNSTPIYLADKKDDYRNIDYQILYFTIEDAKTVKKIIEAYNSEKNTNEQFTRGLYYRSVK